LTRNNDAVKVRQPYRPAQITAIGQFLLQKGYFVRCDRVHKTARPGRTKRVKFPKFLETVPRNQQQFSNDGEGFYSWTYDQPMSWPFSILSIAVAFLVILMCLFPLAPIWFKKVILYTQGWGTFPRVTLRSQNTLN
jgi:translocation protein SEC62